MTKLNDIQSILLAAAAARDTGSLLPFPDSLAGSAGRIGKTIPPLIRQGLAVEAEVTDVALVHRSDGDLRYGLFLTDAGRAAINVEPDRDEGTGRAVKSAPGAAPPRVTKSALVIDLLQREQGATLAELIEPTGWLPHTTRAALTGLKKKGHVITKTKRDEMTCYRIVKG